MFHNESLLKDLFEDDQWDRLALFQIKRHVMNLIAVKNIPDIINTLNKFKSEKKEEGIFSREFEMRITTLINRLNEISNKNNLQNTANNLNRLKLEFDSLNIEKLDIHDKKRRIKVASLMPKIINKNAEDYYHAAVIFNHGSSLDDSKLAYEYATKAKELINKYDDSALAHKIREEYIFTYDRYQLAQGEPQKYGTTYSPENNDAKGWEADKLVPPYKGYVYYNEDRLKMNEARKELGVESLEQQEDKWGVPKKIYPTLKSSDSKQNEEKKENEKIKPKVIICGNCGEEGHLAGACIRLNKPK